MSLFGTSASKAKGTPQQPRQVLGYQVQSSCQGAVIALVYGQQRIPGNLLWAANFVASPQYTTTSGAGGAGGGKGAAPSSSTTTLSGYLYYMDLIIGICLGPIAGVATVYDGATPYAPADWFDLISLGGRPASPWGYLSAHYPQQALAYSGIAAACKAQLYLGDSAQLPSFNFEVQGLKQFNPAGGILDANPADILYDFLTNPNYGCGWPAALVGDLTQYSDYCIANSIFLSPQLTSQEAASAFLDYLMQLSNSEIVWSGGQLKAVPYGDTPATGPAAVQVTSYYYIPGGSPYTITVPNWLADYEVMEMQQTGVGSNLWENYAPLAAGAAPPAPGYYSVAAGVYTFNAAQAGVYVGITYWSSPAGMAPVTFTPNVVPQYNLGTDDFIADKDQPPVTAARKAISDAYNWFQVEYYDRANSYDPTIADCKDQNAIALYGPRIQTNVEGHAITNGPLAQFIGQTLLQKSLYIRNTYKFKVDGRYFLLDPMDWVSLTVPNLGLSGAMCRIISIEESDDGSLAFEVEEWPEAAGTPAIHTMQAPAGLQLNLNADPGNVNPPIIFEAPALLTQAGYEVWVAACGGLDWGGAEVWISYDNITYKRAGLISNPCRMGVLAAQLASGSDPDTVDSCLVDLTESRGVLLSGTQQDADLMATACYVDGEVISYETAALTAPYKYTLGAYLRRGAYLTPITAHAQNSAFCRLDQAVFKLPFQAANIGQTLYIKFLSNNLWGGATQELSEVEPYTHYLSGASMTAGLPAITGLASFYQAGQISLIWNQAADPLAAYRQIDYEVRKGTAWAIAEIVGRTSSPNCPCFGNGTYWVATHYNGFYGAASSIVVTNSSVFATILASYDDYANGWPGTMSGGVFKDGNGYLEISGGGPGYYTIAAAQLVNLGSCQLVTVAANYLFESVLSTALVSTWTDWDSIPDVDGLTAGNADVQVQIQVSTDGTNWGDWQELHPGQYYAWKINLRLVFTIYQAGVTPIVSEFNWQVGH
jgi:hypothetical protein